MSDVAIRTQSRRNQYAIKRQSRGIERHSPRRAAAVGGAREPHRRSEARWSRAARRHPRRDDGRSQTSLCLRERTRRAQRHRLRCADGMAVNGWRWRWVAGRGASRRRARCGAGPARRAEGSDWVGVEGWGGGGVRGVRGWGGGLGGLGGVRVRIGYGEIWGDCERVSRGERRGSSVMVRQGSSGSQRASGLRLGWRQGRSERQGSSGLRLGFRQGGLGEEQQQQSRLPWRAVASRGAYSAARRNAKWLAARAASAAP